MKCKTSLATLCCALVLACAAQAQTDPIATRLKNFYTDNKSTLLATVERMPAEHFGFKPTADVRSFAAVVGHISNVNYMTCAPLKGEANPNKTNWEQTATTKDVALTALKDSFAYCDGAFGALTDAALKESYKQGTRDIAKAAATMFSLLHAQEHYGNLVTYLRLKGIVPPRTETMMAAPATKPAGELNGQWKFVLEFEDGRKTTPSFSFKQEGEQLSGAYSGGLGEAPVTGTMKGDEVTFSFTVKPTEQTMTVTFIGKLDSPTTMRGTVKATAFMPPAKWTATRQ